MDPLVRKKIEARHSSPPRHNTTSAQLSLPVLDSTLTHSTLSFSWATHAHSTPPPPAPIEKKNPAATTGPAHGAAPAPSSLPLPGRRPPATLTGGPQAFYAGQPLLAVSWAPPSGDLGSPAPHWRPQIDSFSGSLPFQVPVLCTAGHSHSSPHLPLPAMSRSK